MLESWSDIRAFDGTASIMQPLIRPLYDSRDGHQLLAMLQGEIGSGALDIVRNQWRAPRRMGSGTNGGGKPCKMGSWLTRQSPKLSLPTAKLPSIAPAAAAEDFTLVLSPDPSVFDGSLANNAWLQECPKPFTSQVWGNALHVAEADAHEFGLNDGDVVQLKQGDVTFEAAVLVRPGQAARVLSTTLGYGRRNAGSIGTGIGFNAYRLRRAKRHGLSKTSPSPRRRAAKIYCVRNMSSRWRVKQRSSAAPDAADLAKRNFH